MSNLKTKDSSKSLTTTSKKKVSPEQTLTRELEKTIQQATENRLSAQQITPPDFLPCVSPEMRKSAIQKYERALKWEKEKTRKVMNDIIYEHTIPLTETLIDIAIKDRNPQAINSLLDRGLGAASKNVNIGGQVDNPIVFLPSVLMDKYKLTDGVYRPVDAPIPPQYEGELE